MRVAIQSFCLLLGVLLLALPAAAKPKLENELRGAFVGKVFLLKSTCTKTALHFSATGEITDNCPAGGWSLYSRFHLAQLALSKHKLTLIGTREIDTAVAADTGIKLEIGDPFQLVLDFQLSAPLTDLTSVAAVIAPAFESPDQRAAELGPYAALFPAKPPYDRQVKENSSPCRKENTAPIGMLGPGRPIYRSYPNCPEAQYELPKPHKQVDPGYTQAAREARVSGNNALWIVVNERGQPEILRVARRIGFGLDESAIYQVSTWKFEPAKKAGKQVATVLWVELSYHMQ
jgi:TonB family protein